MARPQFFKFDTLLLAALFATLPLYSPSLAVFHDLLCDNETLMEPAMYAMMVTAIVVSVIMALCCAGKRSGWILKAPTIIVGAACYLGGYALLTAVLNVEAMGYDALAIAGGVLLGVGSILPAIAWGEYMSMYNMRQALLACALAVGLASALRLIMSFAPTNAAIILFYALAVVGVALPCVKAVRGTLDQSAENPSTEDAELENLASQAGVTRDKPASATQEEVPATVGPWQGLKRMAKVAGMPFLGLLVFAFVMGARKTYVFDTVYIEMISDLVAAILVLPLVLVKMERPLMPLIYDVILPIFSAVLLVLYALMTAVDSSWLATMGTYIFYSALVVLALACLCAMAHAREFSPTLIWSTTAAFFAFLSLLGILTGTLDAFEEDDGDAIMQVVNTIYFAFVLIVPILQAWMRKKDESGKDIQSIESLESIEIAESAEAGLGAQTAQKAETPTSRPVANADLRERCDHVAERCGLSPRETEVLAYLGRGHGVAFVAESLVVSESTVRTHVKNIYRKLGVSSREELLEFIDSEELD